MKEMHAKKQRDYAEALKAEIKSKDLMRRHHMKE
jgi:hypothetical protein